MLKKKGKHDMGKKLKEMHAFSQKNYGFFFYEHCFYLLIIFGTRFGVGKFEKLKSN